MNPESSSYGETLHEDSYEYEGDMMLMQNVGDLMTVDEGGKTVYIITGPFGNESVHESRSTLPDSYKPGNENAGAVTTKTRYPIYEYNEAGRWQPTGNMSELNQKIGAHQPKISMAPSGPVEGMEGQTEIDPETGETKSFDFTYKETDEGMEFDPTSEEFRQYVGQTGKFDAIITGLGGDVEDFEDFYGKPLDFLKDTKTLDLAAIAETERAGGVSYDIAGEAAQERLRSAEKGYSLGMESAGLQVGKSLFDVKQQTDVATAKGGLATHGTVAGITQRAQKGIFGDYAMQQKQLAEGLTGSKSAFDITQKEIAEGRKSLAETAGISEKQTELTYDIGVEDFWKKTEEELWGQASTLGL